MKSLVIVLALLFAGSLFAQQPVEKLTEQLKHKLDTAETGEELLVWIFFTDKGNNTEEMLANPEAIVSRKSLERRSKVMDSNALINLSDLRVNKNYLNEIESLGFRVKQQSKWLNAASGFVSKDDLQQIVLLPFIRQADIVYTFKRRMELSEIYKEDEIENLVTQPEGIHSFNYGPSFTQVNQINVPAVHDLGFYGQGVTVCLMDAGFNNLPHEVFATMNIISTWDFVNGDPGVGDSSDMGYGGHGTNTLSTIGGFKEGQLIGPAFGSDYLLAKTENTESETPVEEDNWIAALEWADSIGVDVTSTSLSYLDFDFGYPSYTWMDMDGNTARITIAGDLAVAKGIVVVNSAGNYGEHPTQNTLGAPADGDSILTIGAVRSSGEKSGFSSVGPTFDGRTKPDVMAMGSSVVVAGVSTPFTYTTASGTSFSCPLAAGVCALLLSANPNLTPMQVVNLLRSTASNSANPNNLMGWGIVNALDALNGIVTSVNETQIPEEFVVINNYPNPFNPSTKIRYTLVESGQVQLTLYDILGNKIKDVYNDFSEAGTFEVELNASNLASGTYMIVLNTGGKFFTHKISLVK